MLKGVVRFNPTRKNDRLNNLMVHVWQEKKVLRAKKQARLDATEEMYDAFQRLEDTVNSADRTAEELRAAIERAEPIAKGGPMIACIFKAKKKLKMMEGDLLLKSVVESEDMKAIKDALYEVKAVPYVDTALQVELQRRVRITEAENKLKAAMQGDCTRSLRVAMNDPALGNCIPGRDVDLFVKARDRLATLVQDQAECEAVEDRKCHFAHRMRTPRSGTSGESASKPGTPSTAVTTRTSSSRSASRPATVAVSVGTTPTPYLFRAPVGLKSSTLVSQTPHRGKMQMSHVI